jgi:hypothetical protein
VIKCLLLKKDGLMKIFLKIPLKIWILSSAILIIPMLTDTVFEDDLEIILNDDTAVITAIEMYHL